MSDNPILSFAQPKKSQLKTTRYPQSELIVFPEKETQKSRLEERFSRMRQAFITSTPSGTTIEKVLVLEIIGNKIKDLRSAANKVGLNWLDETDDELDIEQDSGFLKKVTISEVFFKTKKIFDQREPSEELFQILKDKKFIIPCDQKMTFYWDTNKSPMDFIKFIPNKFKNQNEEIINTLDAKAREGSISSTSGRLFLFMSNQSGLDRILKLWGKYTKGEDFITGTNKE